MTRGEAKTYRVQVARAAVESPGRSPETRVSCACERSLEPSGVVEAMEGGEGGRLGRAGGFWMAAQGGRMGGQRAVCGSGVGGNGKRAE